MKIILVAPNSYGANTYLLVADHEALVIDPSTSVNVITKTLNLENAVLKGILLTHGHFDHTVSVDTLRNAYDVPLMIHQDDAPMLTDGFINGFYDFFGKPCTHKAAQKMLVDKEKIALGNEEISVISTPGHSPGSICFECKDDNNETFYITGDTIFASSIGRCDLWKGDEAKMRNSLRLISSFDHKAIIYPGHGASCSLADALKAAKYYIDF